MNVEQTFWKDTSDALAASGIHLIDPLPSLRDLVREDRLPYKVSSGSHPNLIGNTALATLLRSDIDRLHLLD